jgi:phosphoserine phosphatase
MLKAIFFDLDDTLLVTDASYREAVAASCAEAARRCAAIHAERLQEMYLQVGRELWLSFDLPRMQESAVEIRRKIWAEALRRVGVEDEPLADFLGLHHAEERRAGYRLFPGALEVLKQLHGRCHLGIITNGLTEIQKEKIDRLGIEPYFDTLLISQEVGIAKPDAGIFQLALERVPCEPWEAVMVGDSLARDIAGARGAGMHSLWVRLGRPRELWPDPSPPPAPRVPGSPGRRGEPDPFPGPSPGRRGETGSGDRSSRAGKGRRSPGSSPGRGGKIGRTGARPETAHAILECLEELLPWLEAARG